MLTGASALIVAYPGGLAGALPAFTITRLPVITGYVLVSSAKSFFYLRKIDNSLNL